MNFIETIHIKNFKSLRDCEIQQCKRINLFIGRPNVGKSNILEALSLFSIPFLWKNSPRKLSKLIRLENEAELFYDGNTDLGLLVETNLGSCNAWYHPKMGLTVEVKFEFDPDNPQSFPIDHNLNIIGRSAKSLGEHNDFPIKKYNYNPEVAYKKSHSKYLIPPFGSNLLSIIENYGELKQQVEKLFEEYGLKIAFDKASQSIKIIRTSENGIFLIPYSSVADTLQRVIFYKAAIASNEDSVLLFEEPEAHSYPPYMTHITQEMIYKKNCQFFVATHSPFILNDLLENGRDELAVFIVDFENQETKVKKLSKEELYDVYQNGVDLFTNTESFI